MKNRIINSGALYGIFLIAMCIAVSSCHSEKQEEKKINTHFVLNDSLAQRIKIDTVKAAKIQNKLDLNGEVTFNQNSVVNVMPLITGVVEEVSVQLGDYVQKGQILATIKSTELSDITSELAGAEAELTIAKKNLEVVKDLSSKGINSEREVLEATQSVNKLEAEVNNKKKNLAIIGSDVGGNMAQIKSPGTGYIVERNINQNQVIDSQQPKPIFVVSDLQQVWIIADVYEVDIAKVSKGQSVSITTIAYPDKTFKGVIDYVSNVLDPDNKTMKIRVVLDNPKVELKPEMFAKISLDYIKSEEVAAVPSKSIVFDDSKSFVVVYESKDKISVRPVDIASANENVTYIKNGLKPGERVVSKEQLYIYNAIINL